MTMDKGEKQEVSNKDVTDFEVYNYYFTEIENIFSDYGSKIIVLYMPYLSFDLPGKGLTEALSKHPEILMVNGSQAVKDFNVPTLEFEKRHPQPKAHEAYAWEAIKVIGLN